MKKLTPSALNCALGLLSRREHSAQEVLTKLRAKGYLLDESQLALATCQQEGWQSDERYCDMLCRTRINQGYGPLRISQELYNQRIANNLIENTLSTYENNWEDYALTAWQKKFKTPKNSDLSELQKQQRFLIYRGFPHDIIRKILKNDNISANPL